VLGSVNSEVMLTIFRLFQSPPRILEPQGGLELIPERLQSRK
jgi:hypothetical protein